MLAKLRAFIVAHKILSGLIVVTVVFGGYAGYKKLHPAKTETRYVLGAVEKGTLVRSVSGSGQVAASDQVDIKPEVSGKVTYVAAVKGQEIKANQIIAQIDAADALKALRDAQTSLKTAQLSLAKVQAPPDALALMQTQDAVQQAQDAEVKTKADLAKAYDDAFNDVSGAFLDLPNIMTGLDDVLYGSTVSGSQSNVDAYADAAKRYDPSADLYRDSAVAKYQAARPAYDAAFNDYKLANRASDTATIEHLVVESYSTVKNIADATKAATDLIQFYKDQLTAHSVKPSAVADTNLSSLGGFTSTLNGHATALLNDTETIQSDKDAITSDARAIVEKQTALDKLNAGADELDLTSAQLSVQERRDALDDAEQTLAKYTVRAPFDGIMADVKVKKGDTAASGTAVATIITAQQVVGITLNEVDIAKVAIGQKATLTFDTLPDFSLTGSVIDIDTLGTVSQGVVTYGVKIGFDTQDPRIKPGMSATANIVTDAKTDVLLVPSSAVKTQNGESYVEELPGVDATQAADPAGIASATAPQRVTVQTGLSNDTQTEITSGLNEGDLVVTRTITASSQSSTTQSRNILQAAGAGGRATGGGGARAGGDGNAVFIGR